MTDPTTLSATIGAVPMATKSFTCACERTVNAPVAGEGLPAGWQIKIADGGVGWMIPVILCPECANVEALIEDQTARRDAARAPASSATPSAPPAAPAPATPVAAIPPAIPRTAGERRWQITVTFHTEKGSVETVSTVRAINLLAAIDDLEVVWSRVSEMVAMTVVPAPLELN